MKILIFLLAFLIPLSTPLEEHENVFFDEVNNKYEYYKISSKFNYDDYALTIAQGIYSNEASYGFCFTCTEAKTYYMTVEIDGKEYFLPTNNRLDGTAIAIKADKDIIIHIYDRNNREQTITDNKYLAFTKADIDTSKYITGANNSGGFTALSEISQTTSFFRILIIVSLSVIAFCGLFLLVLFISRRGFFNSENRKKGVISMKDILNKETDDAVQEDYWDGYETVEPISSETKEIVNKDHEDEEVISAVNIKEYLQEKGYVTNYSLLSEDEKNKIMIELMMLKNQKQISLDDYYKETKELWKN